MEKVVNRKKNEIENSQNHKGKKRSDPEVRKDEAKLVRKGRSVSTVRQRDVQ